MISWTNSGPSGSLRISCRRTGQQPPFDVGQLPQCCGGLSGDDGVGTPVQDQGWDGEITETLVQFVHRLEQ